LTQEALVLQLSVGFGQGLEPFIDKDNVVVLLRPAQIPDFARFAKDKLGFDMLDSITAVDNVDAFELLYHWVSIKPLSQHTIQPSYPGYLLARVAVPKNLGAEGGTTDPDFAPVVPSITRIFPGANHQEREIWDLMGIRFRGHPKLERILLWEGFPGHPLRKDWKPLNAEIPWHLAGLKGYGGEPMENPPAEARIADDGSGIGQPIPVGTTPQGFRHPASRPPKPTEIMRIKLGQGGIVDDETPDGPRSGYGAAHELSEGGVGPSPEPEEEAPPDETGQGKADAGEPA
jgi:NADH:ubiquinone oxidoreductase subunit C